MSPYRSIVVSDLNSFRIPEHSVTSITVPPVASTWFEDGASSSERNGGGFKEGLICCLYHVLFQCSNETSGLVSFLMALVSRYAR